MWIDIKGRLYNLDHISHIVKMVDECESYKKYCIKVYFANEVKIPLGFHLIEFDDQTSRDMEFERIHQKISKEKPIQSNKVTRFEVITQEGRAYVNNKCSIESSYQDDDRTLKVFVK